MMVKFDPYLKDEYIQNVMLSKVYLPLPTRVVLGEIVVLKNKISSFPV